MGILYLGNQKVTPFVYKDAGKKYNVTITTFLGDIDANGVISRPSGNSHIVFYDVRDVAAEGLSFVFAYNSYIESVSFPDLVSLSSEKGLYNMAYNTTSITNIDLPKLTTISGSNAMYYALTYAPIQYLYIPKLSSVSGTNGMGYLCFQCKELTDVDLSELASVTGSSAMQRMFYGCNNLQTIAFPKLSILTGEKAMERIFYGCSKLTDIYFTSLTSGSFGSYTNQFLDMLSGAGTTVTHTIHFPSNLESTIQGLTGYPLFGGTSGYVVLSFDLPATE